MIILPSRVKNEDEKKKTGLILPSRVKDAKTVEQTESVLPKKNVVLPPKKQVSEVEAYNKEQSGFWKTIARVLLPKKLESKYGVEKIEPVKTTLSGGWENLTPEQQDTAKEIFKKETPTALKAKVPMFFQSLKETSTKDIPYYGSGKEAVELVGIARAYNRVKDGKGTEQDKILLNDYYEEQERQTELQKNVGYRAGETIKGSVRFMGELLPVAIVEALTGTLAPAGEVYAASKLAQKGTKQVIEGMIKDKVTRDLVKDVAKKKLATLTKQFIITAPTNITAGTAERMIGVVDTETGEIYQEGQPISDAIVNATTGHAVELITELGGGVSGKVLGGLTAPVKKIATKTAIFNALRKKLIGASDAKIEALLRKTGWNGVIGEFFEERDADILNQALYSLGLGDQKFEGLTKDDIATELIAFSVMGGGVAGIKSVKRLKEGLQKRQDIKKMQETKVKMPPKKAPVSSEIAAPTSVQTQETVKDTTQPTEAPKTVKMPPEKVEDPLIQEAKKYKSAEEFVRSQIKRDLVSEVQPVKIEATDRTMFTTASARAKSRTLTDKLVDAAKRKQKQFDRDVQKTIPQLQKEVDELRAFAAKEGASEGSLGIALKEELIATKSQLEEIWNKANQATAEQSLIQEAKKYKSAEEFVNDNLEVDTLLPSDRPMGEKTLADFKYTGSKVNKQKVKVSPIEDVINKAKTLADSGGDGSVGNYEVYDVLKKVNNGRIKVYHGTSETGANAIGGGWAGLKDGSYLSLTKGADKEALGVYGAKYYADIAERYGKNGQVLEFDIPLKNIAIDNTTGELRYVSDKTKSQLEEIWNRAQEVSPVEQKVVEKVEPIKYKSTIGKSGLAQSVRRKAIREKLIYGFDKRFRDLPEYDKRVKTEDRDKAIDFVLNDTDNAYEVAMGRQKPKGDMLPEDVYVVMVDYLTEIEDVEKVLDLTMNSELVGEATLMGQRIQALSQLDPLNPAKVLNDIKKEKEKALAQDKKKRGKKSKAEETRDMKDKIDKDTQKGVNQSRKKVKTWVELVESLKC